MSQVKPLPQDFDLAALSWVSGAGQPKRDDPVEVAFVNDMVLMRNGSDAEHVLVFTQAEWDAFVSGALDGEFDY
ncbi:DUF397 domain-containing protein [Nonomuraea sp. NBC_01738]|uniref:DUF397 domain-containing protein n=1 Tax=Nonomuraea sp. NBC_01738 TaxID=2976003 RepID=UPI002E15F2F4|nr:DUF397 domain-containing protein [Nonomuraea sp. NBC_01738]